ncbi:replication initiation protein, partial [Helicobacter ailurogastricus]|uniref:replication initiation protein n=1 Tax=Helicobacter ailurogastricus TaxID=1578720 RepID=UPI002556B5DA
MDTQNPAQQLKALRNDLDNYTILEAKCAEHPELIEKLFPVKAKIIKDLAQVVLAHEWKSDDTSSINTSQKTKDTLKHFSTLMASLQEMLDNAPSPTIKEGLEFGIKDCIDKMEGALTAWTEWIDPKDKPKDTIPITEFIKPQSVKTQEENTLQPQPQEPLAKEPKETLQPLTQEPPQEVAKEIVAQEPQTALAPIMQREAQELVPIDPSAPHEDPTLAKNLKIANPNQIIMHNNIYKVNLGTLGELESNLFFSFFNRLKDQQDTIIRFAPKDLKAMAGNTHMSNKTLYGLALNLFNSIAGANFDLIKHCPDGGTEYSRIYFFRRFTLKADKDKNVEYLDIQVNNPYFTYLLNDLRANFTAIQLSTYASLSGKYPKNLFRLLERYKNEAVDGVFQVHMYQNDLEGFCAFMGVPKDFRANNIDSRVINPSIKQLTQKNPKKSYTPPYKSIKVIKNKAKAQGAKVLGYIFEVTLNTDEQEPEKESKNAKNPYKYFTKKDLKALECTKGMEGTLVVKDQGGKDFTLNYACVVDFIPSPKKRGLCVQFRVNGGLNPEIMAVIALHKTHENLFKVCGNEYLCLVFKNMEEYQNHFLNTAHPTTPLASTATNIPNTPKAIPTQES